MTNPYLLVSTHQQKEQTTATTNTTTKPPPEPSSSSRAKVPVQTTTSNDSLTGDLLNTTNNSNGAGEQKPLVEHKALTALKAHKPVLQLTNSFEDYTIEKKLGEGGFGDVVLARTSAGQEVVIKKIKKSPATDILVENEVEAGRRLKHKNVVHLYGYFDDDEYHYLVMEYIKGIDLFTYMENRDFTPIKEIEAKKIFRQLVQAVQHSHKRGIAHLDIKMENVLLQSGNSKNSNHKVKLIDYGLCDLHHPGKLASRWVGSPDYAADELLMKRPYKATKADVWSLGVILYIMLFGQIPFERTSRFRNLQKGVHPKLNFPRNAEAQKVSTKARDLLTKMLCANPTQRFDMDQVAEHPWVAKQRTLTIIDCLGSGNSLDYDTE